MRTSQRIALGVLLVLLVTACAEDDDPGDAEDASGDADVAVSSTDLGEVLVDADGMTLYMFENDDGGVATCTGECAASWPPLLADGEPTGAGLDADLLGTTEHPESGTQVTYAGWPLYRWAGDDEPGDTGGQGFGDVWWTLDADGEPVRDEADDGAGSPY